jgi:hypothetical protein
MILSGYNIKLPAYLILGIILSGCSQSKLLSLGEKIEDDTIRDAFYKSYNLITECKTDTPFHFINGCSKRENENRWQGYYWHLNTRCVYGAFWDSEISDPYFELYLRNYDKLKTYTKSKYGIEGIKVPEVMSWEGETIDNGYTDRIFSTGLEFVNNCFLHFEDTEEFYFFAKEVCNFYTNYILSTSSKPYQIKNVNAKETYWNVNSSLSDIAGIRTVFPLMIFESRKRDKEWIRWLDILVNLEPIPEKEGKYIPCNNLTARNKENVELEGVYPFYYYDRDKAISTYQSRRFKDIQIWSSEPIWAAELGMEDEALRILKEMIIKNCQSPDGICDDGNGRFETNGIILTTIKKIYSQKAKP